MSQTNWEADKMLDVYIYDYLVKRNLHASAKSFQSEGSISSDPIAIDAPGGFLFEWWSVFWDIFIARTNEKHSEVAASYIETQLVKAREQQQPQQQSPQTQTPQEQQQLQMQQLLLQRHVQQQQQQQREGSHLLNGTANGLVSNDSLMRQNPGTANALATKMYEERLKLPLQRDSLEDASLKQRFGGSGTGSQLLDPNHSSMLKSVAAPGQASGQVLHGKAGGMSVSLQQVQARNQQLPGPAQDMKNEINQRAACPDGSLMGVPGSNQGGNNLTLKGWPLTGFYQLRSGILQQQKSFMHSHIPQLHLLTPQQQQLLIQAQQSTASPLGGDTDSRRLRMLFNNRNMVIGKDSLSSAVGDVGQNVGTPMQAVCPVLPLGDTDMLIKVCFYASYYSCFVLG